MEYLFRRRYNSMFYGATDFEQTLCWDLMSDSETDSMLTVHLVVWIRNAVSALLQPWHIWASVHKKEKALILMLMTTMRSKLFV
jgi:hypothetical protein